VCGKFAGSSVPLSTRHGIPLQHLDLGTTYSAIFVRGKYRDVILPMTVIRRLDSLLEPTKQAVLGAGGKGLKG
jgi:hypothetical protein